MSNSIYSSDRARVPDESQPITEDMFGANIVAHKNTLIPGGPFDTTLTRLGVTDLRYPGGTVTEQHFDPLSQLWADLFGPSDTQYVQMTSGDYAMGPAPVIDYSNTHNLDLTLVIPTDSVVRATASGAYVVDQAALAEVQSMVGDMLAGKYGDANIERIEIGNEYQCFCALSPQAYGMVANELILAMQAEFDAHAASGDAPHGWQEPTIAIQMGAAWQHGDSEAIIDALDMEARAAVDELVIHYYPPTLEEVGKRNSLFEHHEVWDNAEGFEDLSVVVTEWNIQAGENSDQGLAQASSLISAFDEMVREGVDAAQIWGVQFRFSQSALSTISDYDHPTADQADIITRLTAPGEIFASLSESTLGYMPFDPRLDVLLDRNGTTESIGPANPDADMIVNAFGDEDSAVFYFSSRSDKPVDVSLNLDAYFGQVSHVWGEVLTTVDNPRTAIDESDPLVPNGIPEFETLTSDDFANGAVVELDPYEILRVNVQLDWQGVTMRGHDGSVYDPINLDDTLIGSTGGDSIHGFAGNDRLLGAGGNDVIHGGDGNDILDGSTNADTLRGGADADHLTGGSGADVLSGGLGNDTLFGGTENDVLLGGAGNDTLDGGAGSDILRGGAGHDTLHGGTGGDYFVIDQTCRVVIDDWDPSEGDKITFLGQFDSFADLESHTTETSGTAGAPGDLVINGPEGSQTIISGAAGKLGWLESRVVDFTPEGEAALDLADDLNARDGEGIDRYIGGMTNSKFDQTVLNADPVLLFARLDSDSAAHLLGAMDEEQASDFLYGDGKAGLSLFFEHLPDDQMNRFINTLSSDALETTVDHLGFDSVTARAEDVSAELAATLDRKLQQTSYRREDEDEDDGNQPPPDPDPDPDDPDDDPDSGSSSGGGCFVATAVYGDRNHPDVRQLRWYRDTILRQHLPGRAFIAFYAKVGPPAARFVHPRPRLRAVIHAMIARLVVALNRRYGHLPKIAA